jgi:hypothetical protein
VRTLHFLPSNVVNSPLALDVEDDGLPLTGNDMTDETSVPRSPADVETEGAFDIDVRDVVEWVVPGVPSRSRPSPNLYLR